MADQLDPALIQQVLALQSNDEDPQAIQLARKQKMVDALRTRSMTPLEGQMVGRRYVAPSPLAGVAQVLQARMAGQQQGDVDTGMQALSGQRQSGRAAYLQALTGALRRPRSAPDVPPAVGQIPDQGDGNDVGLGYGG